MRRNGILRIIRGLVTVALAAGLAGCAGRPITPRGVGPLDAPRKILIATQASDFKVAVVAAVIDAFRGDPVYIRVIGFDELLHIPFDPYDAVLVLNTCKAWSVDYRVARLLRRPGDHDRLVLLTTADDPDWEADAGAVDAMTAASATAEPAATARILVEKLRARLLR